MTPKLGIALNFQKLSCAICCVRFIKFLSSKSLEMLVQKFNARTIRLQEQKVNEPCCHAALQKPSLIQMSQK
jgi:hypothetical protein